MNSKTLADDIFFRWQQNCKKRELNSKKMLALTWYEDIFTPWKMNALMTESKAIHQEWKILWDLLVTHDLIKVNKSNSNHKQHNGSGRWE